MKLKQVIAGVLTGAMIVTGMPFLGLGQITVQAESTRLQTGAIRYRSIPSDEMSISTDWAVRDTAPLDNALSDAPNFALSRYNTGGIPRSSQLTERNKIYVKMDAAADLTKLVWWPNEDSLSGGRGENVHNGTVTRLKVSYTKDDLSQKSDAAGMAAAAWTEQEGDVRFDSNDNDNADDNYGVQGIAHDIDLAQVFGTAPTGITGVKLEILNTAGVYDLSNDVHDTFISGRELQLYVGDTAVEIGKLHAYADFACEDNDTNGHFGADKLVDGKITETDKMHSVWDPTGNNPNNSDQGPVKTDSGEYFANNNIYLDLSKSRQIGKLTYVSGTSVGSIQRCNIYVSDVQLSDGQKPEDIADDDWELAYTNVPQEPEDGGELDTSKDWPVYNPQANINGNSHEAPFTTMHTARYVRIEVKNTRGTRTAFSNKWINIGRIYVYDAESVYTGERANVALGSRGTTIQAYTGKNGHADSCDPEYVIDGQGNDASEISAGVQGNRWLGSALMKSGGGSASTGKVNYLILDLGEDTTVRNVDAINLRWAAKAVANSYWIDTSDTCDVEGDVTDGAAASEVSITQSDIKTNGWEKIVDFTDGRNRTNSPTPNKLDEFKPQGQGGDGSLLQTTLKRYVRLVILNMHAEAPSYDVAGLKEFEIWGIRETGRLNTVELDLEVPVYKGALRQPGTKSSERYHLDSFEYYEKGSSNPMNKTTETFEAKTYVLEAKIGTILEVGDQLTASVNGDPAEIEETNETCSCGLGGKIVKVTYEFTIADPTEAKTALQNAADRQDIKDVIDGNNRDNQGALVYTVRTWNRLKKAYDFAKDMLSFTLDPGSGSSGADQQEVWYLKKEYDDARTELENAYTGLRLISGNTAVDMEEEPLDVTVTPPAAGQTLSDAELTNPGTVENENLDLVKGNDFRVDDDNYIHGTVTAPNSSEKNDVFKIEGETNFLVYFKTMIPEKPAGKQSIVGRFNQGYGVQIEPRSNDAQGRMNLIAYGYGSKENYWQGDSTLHRVWPTTKMVLPNDWYGKEHTVVVIFNGGYFDLYVDGVKATEVQTHNWKKDNENAYENAIDSSPLALSENASFSIGFNVQDNNEKFTGGLKDFAMYIGSNCPDYSGFSSAAEQGAEQFATALENALSGKTADLTLTGAGTKYQLRSTEWKAVDGNTKTPVQAGETFDRYTDYEVTVTAQTNSGYYFPDAAENHVILRSDSSTTYDDAKIELSEDGSEITITYLFKGEEHPFDSLSKYLASLSIEGIEDKETNEDANGTRVFTAASWQNYIEKYNAAKALVEAGKKEGQETQYSSAKAALETAAAVGTEGGLLLAAQNCECKLGEITFADETIHLDEASAEKTLEAACTVNAANCMKHQTAPAAAIVYTVSGNNTAGASVAGNVLTVTQTGSADITVTATLMDGTRKVDEKTKTAVFTVQSSPVSDRVQTAQQLDDKAEEIEQALKGLNPNKYTEESWRELENAIWDAKALSEKLKNTQDTVTNNEVRILLAKLDVNKLEDAGSSGDDESVSDLRDLLNEIYNNLNSDEYTAESWNAMQEVYNQAADLVNGGNPDPAECKKMLDRLTSLKNALKTKAADLEEAQAEINAKIAAADALIAAGQGTYTKAAWDAFVAAYTAAKNPPAGAAAAKLRELAKALADAQAALAQNISLPQTDVLKAGDSQKYKDVEYRVLDAAAKTAVAYKGQKKKAKSVVVASTVQIKGVDCKVVQISANAFKGYNKMTKLTIGANVKTIGKKAFMGCTKLKTIKLQSKGLKKIQSGAFKKVKGKVKVSWPKGMKAKAKKTLKKNFKKAGLKVK